MNDTMEMYKKFPKWVLDCELWKNSRIECLSLRVYLEDQGIRRLVKLKRFDYKFM